MTIMTPADHAIPIEFESQGALLRGWMLLPSLSASNYPTVIMAHGFSTTIKMSADKYAEQFQKAGFVVILYDHRNLGESGGLPRQEINYSVQARGYIDCMDFAATRAEVDPERMALWGCSSSARLVFVVASMDARPKAIVAQVPALGSSSVAQDPQDKAFRFMKNVILSDDIYSHPHSTSEPARVVSLDQDHAPSYLNHRSAALWFLEYGTRLDTGWVNRVTISRVNEPDAYHPMHSADHIKASVLMVVADDEEIESASPQVARDVFEKVQSKKEWVRIQGGHFGLLHYPSEIFDFVSEMEIEFLTQNL